MSWKTWAVRVGALLVVALNREAISQPCTPEWLPGDGQVGIGGTAVAFTTWDPDGPGPARPELILGGQFTHVGGLPDTRGLARWDGSSWASFPGAAVGGFHVTNAVTTWDPDGPGPQLSRLVVVGLFGSTLPSGEEVQHLAEWDGERWSGLAGGANGEVTAATSWDPDGDGPLPLKLVVGGSFTSIGGVQASGLAAWDGQAWVRLGDGVPGSVTKLISFDPDGEGPLLPQLIVGGNFSLFEPGTTLCRFVAMWDGVAWRRASSGLSALPVAFTIADVDGDGPQPELLLAGGSFGVRGWNGSAWSVVVPGVSGIETIRAMTTWDADGNGPGPAHIVLAGYTDLPGDGGLGVARVWDGMQWSALPDLDAGISGAGSWDPDAEGPEPVQVFVSGEFDRCGPQALNRLARIDGQNWAGIGRGFDRSVGDMTVWDSDGAGPEPERLAVVGSFAVAGGVAVNAIALWDGVSWSSPGLGLGPPTIWEWSPTYAVGTWDPDGDGPASDLLIAGGRFTMSGSTPVLRIAAWDGNTWSQMGAGFNDIVNGITTWDTDAAGPAASTLVAWGTFTKSGTVSINRIARWDGEQWQRLASSINGPVNEVMAWDADGDGPQAPLLVACGRFTVIDQTATNHIVTWDGSDWRPLGTGLPEDVTDIALHDFDGDGPLPPRLVAGGSFPEGIAVWDTTAWTYLSAGLAFDHFNRVADIISYEADPTDDVLPRLLVSGRFKTEGTYEPLELIAWEGNRWVPYGGEARSIGHFQHYRPPGHEQSLLAVSGTFLNMGGGPSSYFALWGCPIAACAADLNGDGIVDFADYLEFLNLYDALDPRADLSGDGVIDFGDYLEFLNHYDAGC